MTLPAKQKHKSVSSVQCPVKMSHSQKKEEDPSVSDFWDTHVMNPSELTFVTWNIDGLDTNLLMERTRAAIETLTKMSADIVFLQEVIPETFSFIKTEMTDYECVAAGQFEHFVATVMRRMCRNLLAVQV